MVSGEVTYGGGLFAPLDYRTFRELRARFVPVNPNCPHVGILAGVSDPACHGGGIEWTYSRHSVQTRDDLDRERRWKE